MIQKLFQFRFFKSIAIAVLVAFVSMIPAQSGYTQALPQPGQMVYASGAFNPTMMTGMRVDLKDPFNLYFVMNNGEKRVSQDDRKEEYTKLIKYFMASLITPNTDMWVNLSPKEADRIIPDNFSMTEMGRDLLAQDYLLKQFTSSLMYPEGEVGRQFWQEIYKKAYQLYGTSNIPVDTFNKVWITADKADIYQKNDTALLVSSHLKVMLEQDFMAIESNKEQFSGVVITDDTASAESRKMVSDIVREVIVPVIEKEVNEGSNFAQVRQVYNAMILATWFKKTLKDSLLGQVYADKSKVKGIELNDPEMKEKIYRQYLEAYKVGVFSYIKEELDSATQEALPRKYFSGGMRGIDAAMIRNVPTDMARQAFQNIDNSMVVSTALKTPDGKQLKPIGARKPVVKSEDLQRKIEALRKQSDVANRAYMDARAEVGRLQAQAARDKAREQGVVTNKKPKASVWRTPVMAGMITAIFASISMATPVQEGSYQSPVISSQGMAQQVTGTALTAGLQDEGNAVFAEAPTTTPSIKIVKTGRFDGIKMQVDSVPQDAVEIDAHHVLAGKTIKIFDAKGRADFVKINPGKNNHVWVTYANAADHNLSNGGIYPVTINGKKVVVESIYTQSAEPVNNLTFATATQPSAPRQILPGAVKKKIGPEARGIAAPDLKPLRGESARENNVNPSTQALEMVSDETDKESLGTSFDKNTEIIDDLKFQGKESFVSVGAVKLIDEPVRYGRNNKALYDMPEGIYMIAQKDGKPLVITPTKVGTRLPAGVTSDALEFLPTNSGNTQHVMIFISRDAVKSKTFGQGMTDLQDKANEVFGFNSEMSVFVFPDSKLTDQKDLGVAVREHVWKPVAVDSIEKINKELKAIDKKLEGVARKHPDKRTEVPPDPVKFEKMIEGYLAAKVDRVIFDEGNIQALFKTRETETFKPKEVKGPIASLALGLNGLSPNAIPFLHGGNSVLGVAISNPEQPWVGYMSGLMATAINGTANPLVGIGLLDSTFDLINASRMKYSHALEVGYSVDPSRTLFEDFIFPLVYKDAVRTDPLNPDIVSDDGVLGKLISRVGGIDPEENRDTGSAFNQWHVTAIKVVGDILIETTKITPLLEKWADRENIPIWARGVAHILGSDALSLGQAAWDETNPNIIIYDERGRDDGVLLTRERFQGGGSAGEKIIKDKNGDPVLEKQCLFTYKLTITPNGIEKRELLRSYRFDDNPEMIKFLEDNKLWLEPGKHYIRPNRYRDARIAKIIADARDGFYEGQPVDAVVYNQLTGEFMGSYSKGTRATKFSERTINGQKMFVDLAYPIKVGKGNVLNWPFSANSGNNEDSQAYGVVVLSDEKIREDVFAFMPGMGMEGASGATIKFIRTLLEDGTISYEFDPDSVQYYITQDVEPVPLASDVIVKVSGRSITLPAGFKAVIDKDSLIIDIPRPENVTSSLLVKGSETVQVMSPTGLAGYPMVTVPLESVEEEVLKDGKVISTRALTATGKEDQVDVVLAGAGLEKNTVAVPEYSPGNQLTTEWGKGYSHIVVGPDGVIAEYTGDNVPDFNEYRIDWNSFTPPFTVDTVRDTQDIGVLWTLLTGQVRTDILPEPDRQDLDKKREIAAAAVKAYEAARENRAVATSGELATHAGVQKALAEEAAKIGAQLDIQWYEAASKAYGFGGFMGPDVVEGLMIQADGFYSGVTALNDYINAPPTVLMADIAYNPKGEQNKANERIGTMIDALDSEIADTTAGLNEIKRQEGVLSAGLTTEESRHIRNNIWPTEEEVNQNLIFQAGRIKAINDSITYLQSQSTASEGETVRHAFVSDQLTTASLELEEATATYNRLEIEKARGAASAEVVLARRFQTQQRSLEVLQQQKNLLIRSLDAKAIDWGHDGGVPLLERTTYDKTRCVVEDAWEKNDHANYPGAVEKGRLARITDEQNNAKNIIQAGRVSPEALQGFLALSDSLEREAAIYTDMIVPLVQATKALDAGNGSIMSVSTETRDMYLAQVVLLQERAEIISRLRGLESQGELFTLEISMALARQSALDARNLAGAKRTVAQRSGDDNSPERFLAYAAINGLSANESKAVAHASVEASLTAMEQSRQEAIEAHKAYFESARQYNNNLQDLYQEYAKAVREHPDFSVEERSRVLAAVEAKFLSQLKSISVADVLGGEIILPSGEVIVKPETIVRQITNAHTTIVPDGKNKEGWRSTAGPGAETYASFANLIDEKNFSIGGVMGSTRASSEGSPDTNYRTVDINIFGDGMANNLKVGLIDGRQVQESADGTNSMNTTHYYYFSDSFVLLTTSVDEEGNVFSTNYGVSATGVAQDAGNNIRTGVVSGFIRKQISMKTVALLELGAVSVNGERKGELHLINPYTGEVVASRAVVSTGSVFKFGRLTLTHQFTENISAYIKAEARHQDGVYTPDVMLGVSVQDIGGLEGLGANVGYALRTGEASVGVNYKKGGLASIGYGVFSREAQIGLEYNGLTAHVTVNRDGITAYGAGFPLVRTVDGDLIIGFEHGTTYGNMFTSINVGFSLTGQKSPEVRMPTGREVSFLEHDRWIPSVALPHVDVTRRITLNMTPEKLAGIYDNVRMNLTADGYVVLVNPDVLAKEAELTNSAYATLKLDGKAAIGITGGEANELSLTGKMSPVRYLQPDLRRQAHDMGLEDPVMVVVPGTYSIGGKEVVVRKITVINTDTLPALKTARTRLLVQQAIIDGQKVVLDPQFEDGFRNAADEEIAAGQSIVRLMLVERSLPALEVVRPDAVVHEGAMIGQEVFVTEEQYVNAIAENRYIKRDNGKDQNIEVIALTPTHATHGLAAPAKTVEDFNNKNAMVVLEGIDGTRISEFVSRAVLGSATNSKNALRTLTNGTKREVKEILLLGEKDGKQGETVGRMVKVWGERYQTVLEMNQSEFLATHALVIPKDGKGPFFVDIILLEDRNIRESIRKSAFEIKMIDEKNNVTTKYYLDRNPLGSRREVINSEDSTILYPLFEYRGDHTNGVYRLDQENNALGETRKISDHIIKEMDVDYVTGEKAVLKLDFFGRIASIEIFAPDTDDIRIELKAERPLRVINLSSQSVIHNDINGHARYEVQISQNYWNVIRGYVQNVTNEKSYNHVYSETISSNHNGVDITVDGKRINDVLSVSHVTEIDGIVVVDYVNTMDKHSGEYAPLGRIIFNSDGLRDSHYTGRTLLGNSLSLDSIMEPVVEAKEDSNLFKKKDQYFYGSGSDSEFNRREVSERRDNGWVQTRTISRLEEVETGKADFDFGRVTSVREAEVAMKAHGVDMKTVLQLTPVKTTEGLEVIDYRKQFDPLEKKLFTIYKYNGKIIKIIIATEFDELTGEVQKSFGLNHNYELNERFEYVNAEIAKELGRSNMAGDIFNDRVEEKYKSTTDENLWEGLEREGVVHSSDLVIVRAYQRLTNPDGSFSEQWSPGEDRVLRQDDDTGRSLATIKGNGDIAINEWWYHSSSADLETHKPLPDSEIPSPNILPRSVQLRYDRPDHEVTAFDRLIKDADNNTGMRYIAIKAEFLKNVLFELVTGRKMREEFVERLGVVARGVNKLVGRQYLPSTKILEYDFRSNKQSPVRALDGANNEIGRWEQGDGFEANGNQKLIVKEKHPVFKYWHDTMQKFDRYGEERQDVPEEIHKNLLLAILGAIMMFPISIIARAFYTSHYKREPVAKKIREMLTGFLYDEDIAITARQRWVTKVLKSWRDSEHPRLAIQGDSESAFLFNLEVVYTLVSSHYIKVHNVSLEDYQNIIDTDETRVLSELDAWAISAGQYLAEEFGRGESVLDKDGTVRINRGTKYAQVGVPDQQIWDKMHAYLSTVRDRLSFALKADLNSGNLENGEFKRILKAEAILDHAMTNKEARVKIFYDKFQAFLSEANFDPAPNRYLKNSQGQEFYIANAQVLSGGINSGNLKKEEVNKYLKSLNRLKWRTFFGWGIKAIHVVLLDGTLLPRFILLGLAWSILTLGKTSIVGWITTTASLFGMSIGVPAAVVLAVVALIVGFGAVMDYKKIRNTDHLSFSVRIGLAVASLVGAAVVAAMPGGGVGILVMKYTLIVPLTLEVLTLMFAKRSNFGLSLYYHYRESINVGRLRANVLVWGQYIAFMGMNLLFGWVTYDWFATQLLLGNNLFNGLGMFMFVTMAYMSNVGIWTILEFLASRIKPSKGIPNPSDRGKAWAASRKAELKEWEGMNNNELLMINYVGPSLTSRGIAQVRSREDIDLVVNNFIRDLLWLVNDGATEALWPLEGMKKNLGVNKTMQDFVNQDVRAWMKNLFTKEFTAGMPLMTEDQLKLRGEIGGYIPDDLSIVYDTPEERQQLVFARDINQLLSLHLPYDDGNGGTKLDPYDSAVNWISHAYLLRDTKDDEGISLGKKTMFIFTYNFAAETSNLPAIEKFMKLFAYISGADVDIAFSPTAISGQKSGAMHGMFAMSQDPEARLRRARQLSRVRRMIISDRNANTLDLRRSIEDLQASLNNPELVIMVAHRNTTSVRRYIGIENYLVEGGQGNSLQGLNAKTGTGWANNMSMLSWEVLMKLSNPDLPRKGFAPDTIAANAKQLRDSGFDESYAQEFGMIGFSPNATGISEDLWAVLQEAHMMMALGYDPVYALSKALSHKRRETFSNYELASAAPRWAGGRINTMATFMNQTINDLGPEAFVEREAVHNTGRTYVAMVAGLVMLVMLPFSVVFGFNPYQGLWLGLSGISIVLNQAARFHGLGLMVDDSGWLFGTARFLFGLFRDIAVFPVRVMLESFSVIDALFGVSPVFKVSGGNGNAHDVKTWEQLNKSDFKFVSYKNIVFTGFWLTALMIGATISGLTIAHISMMFFPMVWSGSILISLFVTENQPGERVWNGIGDNIAALGGVLFAVGLAVAVSFSPWAIFGLVAYAVAMPLLYKMVNSSHSPKLLRLLSQFNRYFVRAIVGALWFALVPASPFVKLNLQPNVTMILPIKQFWIGSISLVGGVLGMIGIGYGFGAITKDRVKALYNRTLSKFLTVRDSLSDTPRTIISQRFQQVNIFVGHQAYKRAQEALNEINDELERASNDNAQVLVSAQAFSGELDTAEKIVLSRQHQLKALGAFGQHLTIAESRQRVAVKKESADNAAIISDEVGGINLNADHLTINIKVDGNGMPLSAQFQDQAMINIQGLSPVIRDITPVSRTNMPALSELMRM